MSTVPRSAGPIKAMTTETVDAGVFHAGCMDLQYQFLNRVQIPGLQVIAGNSVLRADAMSQGGEDDTPFGKRTEEGPCT